MAVDPMIKRVAAFEAEQPKCSDYAKRTLLLITGVVLMALSGMLLVKAYQTHGFAMSEMPFYAAYGGLGVIGLLLAVLSVKGVVDLVERARDYKRTQSSH